MSGIEVPGQARRDPNPLLVLATALDKTNNHLGEIMRATQRIATNTKIEARHIYALEKRDELTWGTYCLACSEEAKTYVYPCEQWAEPADTPPSHISVIDGTDQL